MRKIALVGNPNSGKTSLFNILTGLKQKVANYPGITVDKKSGRFKIDGELIELIDLPGAYSLFPQSKDESIPFEVLINKNDPDHPDLVLYILDASNLKRNLLLLTQIIDLKIPVLVALNMVDQSSRKGLDINIEILKDQLGVDFIPIVAKKKTGIDVLKKKLLKDFHPSSKTFYAFDEKMKQMINEASADFDFQSEYTGLFYFHKLYENTFLSDEEQSVIDNLSEKYQFNSIDHQRTEILNRYKKINTITKEAVKLKEGINKYAVNEKLDKLLTHKVWGYVIFFAILLLIFQAIFSWATYPMNLIEIIFTWGGDFIASLLPKGVLEDLLVNGILAGLSGVIIFIPQILILFFFIHLMEDTGYLARVVFLMDKIMRKFGLSGKSVLPLMSGAACAVPAIMAARNIENWKDRIITIMVTPLMSCSARLPVYILLISLAVPNKPIAWGLFNLQGLALMSLYVLGFLASITAAYIFKIVMKTKVQRIFVMELPDYRLPRAKSVILSAADNAKTFVLEAGKIIIAISVILWALASFAPSGTFSKIEQKYSKANNPEMSAKEIEKKIGSEKLKASFAGIIGKTIEPVIRPLGFDWKIGIALVTSFAAREVFVGTMTTIYGLEGDETNYRKLTNKMKTEIDPETNKPVYSLATVISLMLFYAFALQCMSTMAVTYKETKSWKWPAIQFAFMTGFAYLCSMVVYQLIS